MRFSQLTSALLSSALPALPGFFWPADDADLANVSSAPRGSGSGAAPETAPLRRRTNSMGDAAGSGGGGSGSLGDDVEEQGLDSSSEQLLPSPRGFLESRDKRAARIPTRKYAFVLVGLPARGKTYTGRHLAKYLGWLGYKVGLFNVSRYRRALWDGDLNPDFYSEDNVGAADARHRAAMACLDDAIRWLEEEDGQVVIYDATNGTRKRREIVLDRFKEAENLQVDVILIETLLDRVRDLSEMKNSPDFSSISSDSVTAFMQARIAYYERVYESVDDDGKEGHQPYIKLMDNKSRVVANKIRGFIPARITYYLLNFQRQSRSLWFSRHGESMYNVVGKLGGDPDLSPRGERYGNELGKFLAAQGLFDQDLQVWTSTLRRTRQTASRALASDVNNNSTRTEWPALNEIDAGQCEHLTYAEVEEQFPDIAAARAKNKLTYRYPNGGESYLDVIARVEPCIVELEHQKKAVVVISHQAVLRCLLGYLLDVPEDRIPRFDVPLNTVIRITPRAYSCEVIRYTLQKDTDEFIASEPRQYAIGDRLDKSLMFNPEIQAPPSVLDDMGLDEPVIINKMDDI